MNRTITIQNVAELNRATFKKGELPDVIFYLDTGNLTRNKIADLQKLNVKSDKVPSRAQRKAKKNTILYSTVRPNQEHFGFIDRDKNDLVVSTGFTTIDVIDNDLEPKFLYYLLTQNHITEYLHTIGMNSVSSYPSISPSDLGRLKFKVPKSDEQQKITKVLSDLDAKIELNNKINAELEAMAKLIYDYWFVQFDFPDKNGKPYKSSGGKMVYNQELKREIPEGWEVKNLGDYALIKKGKLITEKTANVDGKIKVVSAGLDYSYFHSEANYPENTITISASGASAGFINFWREPIFACDCTTVRGSNEADTLQLLGFLKMRQEYIYQQARGSAQPHVYPKDIEGLKIAVPHKGLINAYGELVNSGNKKIGINLKENQKLAELRDWLLPMLMNGQVKVGEIEKSVQLNMAAEPEVSYVKKPIEKEEQAFLKRKVLASYIINHSLNDNYFGNVKFEKLLHLADYHAVQRNLGQKYLQQAAGPYDNAFTYAFFTQVEKAKWFKRQKLGNLKKIVTGENHDKSTNTYNYFSDEELKKVDNLINKFKNSNYEQPEIVSTLYAVWNNRIIKQEPITDELLKQDFLKWDQQKAKYKDRLDDALQWMREENLVPNGWGPIIEKSKKKK
ncbi:MAG: restriction endonuclease subunit S [Flavobacteriales bacterium]|nr:restriction endonuclease subunit S [Flavobacteriales bacterium]